jgi:Glu-tRNA(Gln) amidotransferase subunit E-like FAD-binding protein
MLRELSDGKKIQEVASEAEGLSEKQVKEIVRSVIKKNPQAMKTPRPEKALMGLVMKEVRGKAPGSMVMKVLIEEIKKG